jgi:hypothetical protein
MSPHGDLDAQQDKQEEDRKDDDRLRDIAALAMSAR